MSSFLVSKAPGDATAEARAPTRPGALGSGEAPRGARRVPALRFVNVVWGKAFTQAFLDVCLPSQVSPLNLEYCGREHDSAYVLYTSRDDAAAIQRSPAFARLQACMPVDLRYIEDVVPPRELAANKHLAMTACHADLVRRLAQEDCAFVFLAPDTVWADGALRGVALHAEQGKRLVLMPGLRLAKEPFIEELLRRFARPSGELLPIPPRDLVALGLRHLHPDTRSLMWDAACSNSAPSLLLWPVGEEGVLVRAFHLHPILVRPLHRDVIPRVTIDDDYVMHAVPDAADVHVVADSDDVLTFEFTSYEARWEGILPWPQHPDRIAMWARNATNARHRELVGHALRVHSGECGAAWLEPERRSAAVVGEIQSLIAALGAPAAASEDGARTLSALYAHPAGHAPDAAAVEALCSGAGPIEDLRFLPMEGVAADDGSGAGRARCRDGGRPLDPAAAQSLSSVYVLACAEGDRVDPDFVARAVQLLDRHPRAALAFGDLGWLEQARVGSAYGGFMTPAHATFLSPEELVELLQCGQVPSAPVVFRREAVARLPAEIALLGAYAYWFAWAALAFRHGVCFLSTEPRDAANVAAQPERKRTPAFRRQTAAADAVALLRGPALADVLPFFVASGCLSAALGDDAVRAAVRFDLIEDPVARALAVPTRAGEDDAPRTRWNKDWFKQWWGLHCLNARRATVWYKRSLLIRAVFGPFYDLARIGLRTARTMVGEAKASAARH